MNNNYGREKDKTVITNLSYLVRLQFCIYIWFVKIKYELKI